MNINGIADLRSDGDISFFLKDLSILPPFYRISTSYDNDIEWKWFASRAFSCTSAYRMMHHTGEISLDQAIWKIMAPMKVKVFL